MITKRWRASALSVVMILLFGRMQVKAWKPAKMPVPDIHISHEAVVQIQSLHADTTCAGVILGSRVVFTSSECLRDVKTQLLQVYYAPNDARFIRVTNVVENRADKTILLHLEEPLPICERIGERRIGVVHWKRMSEIYMRNILYDRSAWRREANMRFVYATIAKWKEYKQIELEFKQCPATL
uniref:Peptidase S1 domain-containing protein n=1 Tax=Parascaris univalens TaxID=6257 RepID=A0A915AVB0_PARUN